MLTFYEFKKKHEGNLVNERTFRQDLIDLLSPLFEREEPKAEAGPSSPAGDSASLERKIDVILHGVQVLAGREQAVQVLTLAGEHAKRLVPALLEIPEPHRGRVWGLFHMLGAVDESPPRAEPASRPVLELVAPPAGEEAEEAPAAEAAPVPPAAEEVQAPAPQGEAVDQGAEGGGTE